MPPSPSSAHSLGQGCGRQVRKGPTWPIKVLIRAPMRKGGHLVASRTIGCIRSLTVSLLGTMAEAPSAANSASLEKSAGLGGGSQNGSKEVNLGNAMAALLVVNQNSPTDMKQPSVVGIRTSNICTIVVLRTRYIKETLHWHGI